MRRLIPIRNSVICRKIAGGTETASKNGLKLKTQTVDEYEIIAVPDVDDTKNGFKVGDRVMSNSTGDEIEINPGETVYMFKTENLMCIFTNDDI